MRTLRAHVENGRLVLNEPTRLPEGAFIDLTVADPGDDLDDEERAALNDALSAAWTSAKAGELHPGEDLIDALREPK